MTPHELEIALAQFTSTCNYYRHWTNAFHYTDGVAFLVENAGAFWLIDTIAAHQSQVRQDSRLREFQIWEIKKDPSSQSSANLICSRDTNDEAFRWFFYYADFPLPYLKLYLENNVLLLPTER